MTEIALSEYRSRTLPEGVLTRAQGERLWRDHGAYVDVEFPSIKTSGGYRLTSKGWVGHIRLDDDVTLRLEPKTPLSNLFAMIEHAYRFKDLKILPGLARCDTVEGYFDRLAGLLARMVLDRSRKGFHRQYVPRSEALQVVRGRLDPGSLASRPWDPAVRCLHREHTGDIEDNRILAWTLRLVSRAADCGDGTRVHVRRAFRSLEGLVGPAPVAALDCIGRFYDRLNADYEPMHGLCRFFLEFLGPAIHGGARTMLPFLVNMGDLYERFVAGWLREHLPAGRDLAIQHKVEFGRDGDLRFKIDLVLRSDPGGQALAVLDTKYKAGKDVEESDVQQVVAYAVAMGCREAVLVYPEPPRRMLDAWVGTVRVRTLVFGVGGDLDAAGERFIGDLGGDNAE